MSTKVSLKLHMGEAKRDARRGAERGLGKAMEHLLGESRKVVPLEEGTLSRSGTAVTRGTEGAVYYDTVYSRVQHERLDFRHDPGRTAKYLERPFEKERDTMLGLVRDGIRRELGG